jgi:hypothetical protein
VEITHLEAVDGWPALLDIALVDADVHLRVDKHLQARNVGVSQGIENRGLAPREMVDGRGFQAFAGDSE